MKKGYYEENSMMPTTEQAILMLSSHFYESRDGSTGGFFADNAVGKGLDFVWSKASQAEKAEMAMQMFFETTEQYAGNFAREATTTVSGSLGLLQAALGSFTAGLGSADADMKNLTQNLVDAFGAVVRNVVPIIDNLTASLPAVFGALLPVIGGLLPALLTTVAELFRQVFETLLQLLPQLIPVAVGALKMIVDPRAQRRAVSYPVVSCL